MRRRQVGPAAVVAAAMAVLSASGPSVADSRTSLTSLTSLTSRSHSSPVPLYETVPTLFAFDDLAPAEAVARFGSRAAIPVVMPAPAKPKRPPRTGPVGSLPPAGTPQAVLAAAYRNAVARAPRGCHLQVAHLAAIGQVESGSIGGRSVTASHRVTPAIFGPLLDGGPFAVVHDSDGGAVDGASDYDRAVGPLQFLPGSWSWAGRDGDGDGRRDPQNVFDAALATADYLCMGGRDLARPGDLRNAVLSYNQSEDYRAAVLEWVGYFQRHGLAGLVSVAFRVGSGGRASAMTIPTPAPTPPPTAADAPPAKAKTPAGAAKGPVAATPTGPPTTAVPTSPTPSDEPAPVPTPTPAPSTTPSTTPPEPVDPTPTPTGGTTVP